MGLKLIKKKAFELFKQSAKSGYISAYTQLAECHNTGIGTEIDEEKAFECYKKAADEKLLRKRIL